jgi:tetratricopeptide (TPR) repeat protein
MLRISRGFTQEQLVDGIAKKSTLSQIESGKASPSIELLVQIASRLGVGIGELLQDVTWERKPADLLKLANVLFDKQEYALSLEYFKQAGTESQEEGDKPEYLYKLAFCLAETGETDQAMTLLEHLIALSVAEGLHKWRFLAFQQIGNVYFKQQNYKLAQHYWLKAEDRMGLAKDLEPEKAAGLYNRLGVINFYLGDHEKAVEYYLKALEYLNGAEYAAQQSISMMNMAISLNSLGEYDRAAEMYQKLEKVNDAVGPFIHAMIRFHYAVFLSATGRYKMAENLFREVRKCFLELGEDSWLVHVDTERAELCFKRGDYENAIRLCQEVLSKTSSEQAEFGFIQRILGLINLEQAKYDKAIPCFVSALQVFEKLGRFDQVREIHQLFTVCLEKKSLNK